MRKSLSRILKAGAVLGLGVRAQGTGVEVRDAFAAIEGQLEMLRSHLVSLVDLGGRPATAELGLAIEQLDSIILRLRRYREG